MFALQDGLCTKVISPVREIASYETLWTHYSGVAKIANLFREFNHALPSVVASKKGFSSSQIEEVKGKINELLSFRKFSALFYGDLEYPAKLKDAKHPVEVLYYRGALDLLSSRSVAVVGTRRPTQEGVKRARKIAHLLMEKEFTIMSGLAAGIDTAAHQTAIEMGKPTIAVIGTALNEAYPRDSQVLQDRIAKEHLLISQVPFYQYSRQDYRLNRFFFPERNKTMSALSEATIIVEASETSGTLVQARAALEQGRKLFILKSCFEKGLEWPNQFLKKGAIKIEDGSELIEHLSRESNAIWSRAEMAANR